MTLSRPIAVAVALVFAAGAAAAAPLDQPDCGRLEAWAAGMEPKATVDLRPKVQVDALLADDRLVPLFGRGIETWEKQELNDVRVLLNGCRKAAMKRKDRDAGNQLGYAMKAVAGSARSLNMIPRMKGVADLQMQRIEAQPAFPEKAEMLALAQAAIRGEPVADALRAMRGRARMAAEVQGLSQAAGFLKPAEVEDIVARLEALKGAAAEAQAARQAELDAFRQEIAAVPMTGAGLAEIDRLLRSPVLASMQRGEATKIQGELMEKRNAIVQRGMADQRARQAEAERQRAARAAMPVDVTARLTAVLSGNGVDAAALGQLRPGMDYAKVKAVVPPRWGYVMAAGGDMEKLFTPKRKDFGQLVDSERRDGGQLKFETMRGKVGKIMFMEHYTAPIDPAAARAWLIDRFGKPDAEQPSGQGVTMAWSDGGNHLQVAVANGKVHFSRSQGRFRNSLMIDLWSEAYADYLEAARQRCQDLRNKPMGELSVNERTDIVMGCLTP